MGRPPALGGASVRIPAQPVQVINAPGVFAAWAHGGLLQMHQPKTFRDGPAGMVSAWKPQSRKMEREEPRSWLVDKQNLCEAQLPQQLRVPTALGSSAVT